MPRNEQGMALVAVTLLLLVLSMVASTAITDARFSAKRVSIDEIRYRAQLAAEGAVHEILYERLTAPAQATSNGMGGVVKVGDFTVDVTSLNEGGLININRAEGDLISAVFAANGVSESDSIRLAAAILDWRDEDNLKEPGGAEASDYRATDLPSGPRNGYFETKGELVDVKGMTDELYRCVEPLFTVYSTSAEVDLAVAPDNVKTVLRWASTNKWQGREWTADATSSTSILNPYGPSGGSTYRIIAKATGEREVPFSLRATVRVSRQGARPFVVLEWRESFDGSVAERSCPDIAELT